MVHATSKVHTLAGGAARCLDDADCGQLAAPGVRSRRRYHATRRASVQDKVKLTPWGWGVNVELRHLRYFVAVAGELNYTRAAKKLHIAQPPLTRAMKDLERQIGCQLLTRTTRRVDLTAAGHDFLLTVLNILEQVDDAIEHMHAVAAGASGSLSIGLAADSALWVFPRFIVPFERQHPSISLTTREAPPATQVELLREGAIDLGFVPAPLSEEGVSVKTVHRDNLGVALPLDHRLSHRSSVALGELSGDAVVSFQRAAAPALFDSLAATCVESGVRLDSSPKITSASTLVGVLLAEPSPTLIGAEGRALLPSDCGVAVVSLVGHPLAVETVLARTSSARNHAADAFHRFANVS